MNLTFYTPERVLSDLFKKYYCDNIPDLMKGLTAPTAKDDRELFFGYLFTVAASRLQKHECLLKLSDEPWDFEMVDKTLVDRNESPNHWNIQNVQITDYVMKDKIKKNKNIYEIFSDFLTEKKLAPEKGDYKGGILVFYIKLNITGSFKLDRLRRFVRAIPQSKFQQIWIMGLTKADGSQMTISELLTSDDPQHLVPLP